LELQDTLGTRLDYFAELDHATRMLNRPGEALVLQTDFLYTVERVDVCIDFLRQHRHYREAEVYLLRFEQCLTRAMTLVRMYFVGSLRALTQDVARRLAEKVRASHFLQLLPNLTHTRRMSRSPRRRTCSIRAFAPCPPRSRRCSVSSSAAHARTPPRSARCSTSATRRTSARARPCWPHGLPSRSAGSTRGGRSLSSSCVFRYLFSCFGGRLTEAGGQTRAGCSYIKQLCTDEFELYRAFFRSGEDRL
jgi:hypothetical protein